MLTSAMPHSISVFSGRYHIMSNASIVNNCIILHRHDCIIQENCTVKNSTNNKQSNVVRCRGQFFSHSLCEINLFVLYVT